MEPSTGILEITLKIIGDQSQLSIKDNGCGISDENLSRLFEPYFTAKRNGMGIGLATTLNILQSHKAEVEVQSKLNEGTSFILTFKNATHQN
jgi:signal transduction histidine kinase